MSVGGRSPCTVAAGYVDHSRSRAVSASSSDSVGARARRGVEHKPASRGRRRRRRRSRGGPRPPAPRRRFLGHVPARSCADHRDHVLGASDTIGLGAGGLDAVGDLAITSTPPPSAYVHRAGHIGGIALDSAVTASCTPLASPLSRAAARARLAHTAEELVSSLSAPALAPPLSSTSSTSVPPPGRLPARPAPVAASVEDRSRTPDVSGNWAGRSPARSRTNTWVRPAPLSRRRPRRAAAELRAFVIASRAADTRFVIDVEIASPPRHLDRHSVALLHVSGGRLERGREARACPGAACRQPGRSSRSLRRAMAPPRRGRPRCAAPREGLEHPSRAGARPSRRAPGADALGAPA